MSTSSTRVGGPAHVRGRDYWTEIVSLPRPDTIAGWCLRPRSRSISASAWRTASASSGCRCRGLIGGGKPLACPAGSGILNALFTTSCDWLVADLNWVFTLFIVVLGVSAAVWGGWLERAGPRKAGVIAALCWSGGLLLGAVGIITHQLWILWLGTGVLGGIGLGLGYISPVSTLIKWFPDRRGMATGMAIMGFGGGAMIGAPLAQMLMAHFATPRDRRACGRPSW